MVLQNLVSLNYMNVQSSYERDKLFQAMDDMSMQLITSPNTVLTNSISKI